MKSKLALGGIVILLSLAGCAQQPTTSNQPYTSLDREDKIPAAQPKMTPFDEGPFVSYERLNIPTYLCSRAHPCIAPDGSYILFDVHGGSYLFACFKKAGGTWGEAIDLTRHGFNILAGGAYVSPDGKYLFFALNEDIWWVDSKVIEKLRPKE